MDEILEDMNIVLIGMPGVGKSTSGVLVAKLLSRDFIDTDVYIQAREGKRLQEIIDSQGLEHFCSLEEENILSLNCKGFVIATGGSVPYSETAMEHLKKNGIAVYLKLPLETLKKRIDNMQSRGIVMENGETLETLMNERAPLYEKYADVTVDCRGLGHEEVAYAVVENVTG